MSSSPLDYTDNASELEVLFSEGEMGGVNPHETEGQLSVDVAQTDEELIVVATLSGTLPDQVSLHLQNDVLTIRGERHSPVPLGAEYFYEECYWGKFSRTIVLPVDVKAELARSEYRNGVLTIHLPKAKPSNTIPIYVVEE
jgi:HSP20 family protein